MNKKNIIRYILDLILAIGFMLMYDKMAIGMKLHELLGLGLGVGVIVHLILNYKWVISIGKKIFSKDLNKRTRFLYLINLLLLVCMILIMVGGIFISKTILTSISSQNHGLWKVIHVVASNIALILIGIHIGLNFSWVSSMTKKVLKIKSSKKYSQIVARILIGAMFVFGVYNISSQRFLQKTIMVFKVGQMQPGGERQAPPNMDDIKEKPMDNNENNGERPEMPQKPEFKENQPNMKGDISKEATSPIILVINYISILSVFTISTYYIDKFIKYKVNDNGGV